MIGIKHNISFSLVSFWTALKQLQNNANIFHGIQKMLFQWMLIFNFKVIDCFEVLKTL